MVTEILRNGVNFFSKKQKTILSAALIISIMMLLSRVLGLVRARLLAGTFGASAELDIYFAAFRLPDLLFQLLVMGALSSSFIPVFSSYLEKDKEKEAWKVAQYVINAISLLFLVLSIVIFVFAHQFSKLIAPEYQAWQIARMVPLIRIMMVGQFFLILSNFITGILQSYKYFLIPAFAPVLYNVGIIFGIMAWSGKYGILGPTLGVVIGCFLHFLVQLPLLIKLGFPGINLKIDWKHPGFKEVGKLMLPRTLGLAVNQIDPTVDLILASAITGGASIFNLALNIQGVPVGLFGFAIGTAALPTLSEQFSGQRFDKFKEIFLDSFNQIMYLTLPASVFLIILRVPVVRLFLGTGKFDWNATLTTALTLGLFALSIPAQSLVHLLARSFYALHDTKVPVLTSLFSVAVNVVSAIILVKTPLGIAGLALATSIANMLNAMILLIILDGRVGGFGRKELFWPSFKIAVASFALGLAIYLPVKVLDQYFIDTRYTANLIMLVVLVSSFGLLVFLFLSYVLNIKEFRILVVMVQKLRDIPKLFKQADVEEVLSEKA